MAKRNQAIQRLVDQEVVFCTTPVLNGNYSDFLTLSRSDFDMVIVEMEHQGFDFPILRTSLQYMVNRKMIHQQGMVIKPAPFVRIPSNTREMNEWIIKQVLDCGAMGLVLPHLESVEGAIAAVKAARYPQARGAKDRDPEGIRGWSPFSAPDYWGVTPAEYYDCADVWPLDPDGEILIMGIVESRAGLHALPEILKQVKGIGAVWAGHGDLSVSMGLCGGTDHPEVEDALLQILRICKNQGVACGSVITSGIGVEDRINQGFDMVLIPPAISFDQLNIGLRKAGRFV